MRLKQLRMGETTELEPTTKLHLWYHCAGTSRVSRMRYLNIIEPLLLAHGIRHIEIHHEDGQVELRAHRTGTAGEPEKSSDI